MWRLLGNVANWRPLPTLGSVGVRGHSIKTRRVSEKVNSWQPGSRHAKFSET